MILALHDTLTMSDVVIDEQANQDYPSGGETRPEVTLFAGSWQSFAENVF